MSENKSNVIKKEHEVLLDELKWIRERREQVFGNGGDDPKKPDQSQNENTTKGQEDPDSLLSEAREEAIKANLVGITISGGGIRSATFGIGVLQGMAEAGILKFADYLSCVSGGAYAGGWLVAWLFREDNKPGPKPKDPAIFNVEKQMSPRRVKQAEATRYNLDPKKHVLDEESDAIKHLRAYSNFMSPWTGTTSTDVWSLFAIWLRNFLVNAFAFLPIGILCIVSSHLTYYYMKVFEVNSILSPLYCITIFSWVILYFFYKQIRIEFCKDRKLNFDELNEKKWKWIIKRYSWIVNYLFFSLPFLIFLYKDEKDWISKMIGFCVFAIFFNLLIIFPNIYKDIKKKEVKLTTKLFFGFKLLFSLLISSLIISVIFNYNFWFISKFLFYTFSGNIKLVGVIFIIPLILTSHALFLSIFDGFTSFFVPENHREQFATIQAAMLKFSVVWIFFFTITIYLPTIMANRYEQSVFAILGVFSTILIFLSDKLKIRIDNFLTLSGVATLAPAIILTILIATLSKFTLWILPDLQTKHIIDILNQEYLEMLKAPYLLIFLSLAIFYIFMIVSIYRVNLFSLNDMYKNRLVRCYLGASKFKHEWDERWGSKDNKKRDRSLLTGAPLNVDPDDTRCSDSLTGFDPDDDIQLTKFIPGESVETSNYLGPFFIFNTALNLVGENKLILRDRKNDSFFLSPLYCGSRITGFGKIQRESSLTRSSFTLGRAMAISGAAVDPNIRSYQNSLFTFVLTLLNIRLGYWIKNPRMLNDKETWPNEDEPKGIWFLLKELLGQTTSSDNYVHLSDAGDFDNLGVYELIRRRCRFIIAVDAGEDNEAASSNLSNLIRLVRMDFGIRIHIDTDGFKTVGENGFSASHVTIGDIRYDDVDHGQLPGTLVYIRNTMTGDEPPDLLNYAVANPRFPHDSTMDQFFDEKQFESYRALGDHIGRLVFGNHGNDFFYKKKDKMNIEELNIALFREIRKKWTIPPIGQDQTYIESTKEWIDLVQDLRSNPNLRYLAHEIYPEMIPMPEGYADRGSEIRRAETHTVSQMLQIMENTWLSLNLEKEEQRTVFQQGWLNTFRRWSNSATFRKHWAVFGIEYTYTFVRFCEQYLHLGPNEFHLYKPNENHVKGWENELFVEFEREWPNDMKFVNFWGKDHAMKYLILQAPRGTPPPKDKETFSDLWFPSGFVMITDDLNDSDNNMIQFKKDKNLVKLCERINKYEHELFFWIRPAHRNNGLGTKSITKLLEDIHTKEVFKNRESENDALRIRTSILKTDEKNESDYDFRAWKRFYQSVGFLPEECPAKNEHNEWSHMKIEIKKK
jgi:GNAT superfamily N-acetyltransferase